MNAFGPYQLGDDGGVSSSTRAYMQWRRRRRGNERLEGYAAYVLGAASDAPELGALVGAETAAFDEAGNSSSFWRPVAIGVATGVLTFLINRWLERTFR